MKRKLGIFSLILTVVGAGVLLIYITGCSKTCCIGFIVTTDAVSAITESTAHCGGTISSDDEDTVTARGVCWSTRQSPTVEDDTSSDGIGKGLFISNIHGLAPNTIYYVRAYVTNKKGVAYGDQQFFTTLVAPVRPVISTLSVTGITQTTASCGGIITSAGIKPVTARGVCWSVLPDPTTADSLTLDGTGIGNFTSSITGLIAGKSYYIRAYATNDVGTSYGNQQYFTTLAVQGVPVLTTAQVLNVTQITATSGGRFLFRLNCKITSIRKKNYQLFLTKLP